MLLTSLLPIFWYILTHHLRTLSDDEQIYLQILPRFIGALTKNYKWPAAGSWYLIWDSTHWPMRVELAYKIYYLQNKTTTILSPTLCLDNFLCSQWYYLPATSVGTSIPSRIYDPLVKTLGTWSLPSTTPENIRHRILLLLFRCDSRYSFSIYMGNIRAKCNSHHPRP